MLSLQSYPVLRPPPFLPGALLLYNTRVTLAKQAALIVKSTPEGLAVMVPPSLPENTRLAAGKQKGSAAFEILGTVTGDDQQVQADVQSIDSGSVRISFDAQPNGNYALLITPIG